MTTYKTKDGIEYQRYEKFTTKSIATLTWIPLLVGENRVRYFESSQLVEVKSPFDSGMRYDQPEPCTAITLWRPTVEVPITQLGYYREGSKQKAIPGVNLTMCNVRIVLTLPVAA